MQNEITAPVVDFAAPVADLEDLITEELDQDGNPEPQAELITDWGLHLTIGLREGCTAATHTAVLQIVSAWIARHPDLDAAEVFEDEEVYDDDETVRFVGVRGVTTSLPHKRELIEAPTAAGIAVQPCEREPSTRSGEETRQFGYSAGAAWFYQPMPSGQLIPAQAIETEEVAQ